MEDVAVRRRFGRRRASDPHELVVTTIAEHAESLLRVARRYTACQADAEDAYQRALEIFVRHAHRIDPPRAHLWLHTVLKHECFAVAEQRARFVGVPAEEALDAVGEARCVASVEERSERFDELARAAEALRALKPHEVTALVLKAQGLSYAEIADRQGWSYTKVNRCISEGRRSFLRRYEGIESGAECERWLPVLAAMADGEATAEQLVDARPHLRNCAACRSVLAGMHRAHAPVAALLPPAVLGGVAAGPGGIADRLGELAVGLHDRIAGPVLKAQASLEVATSAKVAAVAASTVALAGGGVAIERHAGGGDARAADPAPARAAEAAPSRDDARPAVAEAPLRPATAATTAPAPAREDRGGPPATEPHRDPPPATPAAGAEFAPEPLAPPAAAAADEPATAPAAPARRAPAAEPGGEFDIGG